MRILCLIILAGFARSASAEDWLQWGGPRGDFTVNTPPLVDSWPADGPRQLWKRTLGDGYSCILNRGNSLYTEYRDNNEGVVVALDAKTGATTWEYRYPFKLWPEMEQSFGKGPNATPAIIGDRIISISIDAIMRCLDINSGKLMWEQDLSAKFGRRKRVEEYGYSGSPLVHKNTIIVLVGGTDHAVVAFEPEKGEMVWKSAPGGISYAPPAITSLLGKEQYIYFEPEGVVAIDPNAGKLLWRSPIEFNNGNHLTPVVKCDDSNLVVGSQFSNGGGRLLKLSETDGKISPEQQWFTAKLRASHYTWIRVGDYIYGSLGDNNLTFLTGFEWRTGKLAWRERGFHKAQCLYADEKLVFIDENGVLALAKVSPGGIQILAQSKVLEGISWTLPTIVGTTLYARDKKNILALDLSK